MIINNKLNTEAPELLTIGYEGLKIDDFVVRLKQFNVSRLIDIREIPLSRKPGFSKDKLIERLKKEKIEYLHIKELGSPSDMRNKLKSNLDYMNFFEEYDKYLSQNIEIIEGVNQFISDGINCIMCFERFPDKCHRSVVASKIKEFIGNGLQIRHI